MAERCRAAFTRRADRLHDLNVGHPDHIEEGEWREDRGGHNHNAAENRQCLVHGRPGRVAGNARAQGEDRIDDGLGEDERGEDLHRSLHPVAGRHRRLPGKIQRDEHGNRDDGYLADVENQEEREREQRDEQRQNHVESEVALLGESSKLGHQACAQRRAVAERFGDAVAGGKQHL